MKITKEYLINELQNYFKEHNKIPVRSDFKNSKYTSYRIYERIFGNWSNAVNTAGFKTFQERTDALPSSINKKKYSKEKSKSFKNIGFTENKYYNWYYGIVTKAQNEKRIKTKSQYYEKHHILPRSLGGDNDTKNLVLLTAREHFICHYLLCKMLPENSDPWHSMVKAFTQMKASPNNNRYHNSRLYGYARKNHSNTMSKAQSGQLNSQYGTCWITHSWIENLRIKIPKELIEEYIGQGWIGPSTNYRKLLSWEYLINISPDSTQGQTTNRQKRSLQRKCPFCGEKKILCSCELKNKSSQILKNLNKFFNLSLDNLGTPQFINDWNECKNRIQQLYNKIKLIGLTKLTNYENVNLLLKNLDIIKINRKSNINKAMFKYLYKIQLPNNSIIETTNKKQFLIDNNLSRCITDKQLEKKGYKILSQELIKKGL